MRDYICEFGSAIKFYGGPGKASHKTFVKAPGLKTLCRVKEFTTQTAGQYYSIMSLNTAFKYLAMQAERERVDDILLESDINKKKQYLVQGKYTVEYLRDSAWRTMSRNKRLESHGLDPTLLKVLERRISGIITFIRFTHAIVIDDDGDRYSYNAHPYYHDAPWYDWVYVYYEIKDNENSKAVHYPSRIWVSYRMEKISTLLYSV